MGVRNKEGSDKVRFPLLICKVFGLCQRTRVSGVCYKSDFYTVDSFQIKVPTLLGMIIPRNVRSCATTSLSGATDYEPRK